jgi:NTE family protein
VINQIVPIFSGGGTKISAHIGILDAIHILGINFQHIVGVSGDYIVAALHSSGMTLEQIKLGVF